MTRRPPRDPSVRAPPSVEAGVLLTMPSSADVARFELLLQHSITGQSACQAQILGNGGG